MKTRSKVKALPPGPRGVQLWTAFRRMQKNPLSAFREDIARYGSPVYYAFPLRAFTLVTDPQHVHHILNGNAQNYNKDTYSYRQLKTFVGNGLFTANGRQWKKYRPVLQSALSAANIEHTRPAIDKAIAEWIETRAPAPSQTVDLGFEMTVLTLMAVSRALLGFPIEKGRIETIAKAVGRVLAHTNRRIFHPLHPGIWLPAGGNGDYKASLRTLNDTVSENLDRYRAGTLERPLILDYLYDTGKPDGRSSEEEIRDQILTLFLAGHETTAIVLFWFFYRAARHPEFQAEIRNEITSRYAGNGRPGSKTAHSLVTSALMETMRLYPPIWLFERKALEDDELGPYRIRAGDALAIFCYHIHRNPDLWENPDRFIPGRFADSDTAQYPRYAYFPFGGGGRHCAGNHFAMLELKLAVERLIENYQLSSPAQSTVSPRAGLTLRAGSSFFLKMERL